MALLPRSVLFLLLLTLLIGTGLLGSLDVDFDPVLPDHGCDLLGTHSLVEKGLQSRGVLPRSVVQLFRSRREHVHHRMEKGLVLVLWPRALFALAPESLLREAPPGLGLLCEVEANSVSYADVMMKLRVIACL